MRHEDIPAVSELAVRTWRKHYAPHIVTFEQIEYMLPQTCSAEAISANMQINKQRSWLSFEGKILVGYITMEPRAHGGWFIDKLYVDNDKQRRASGTALLNHVVQALRPSQLSLRVNRKNYTAINFYFKHGFVIETIDVRDIGNGYLMDDFLMKKAL
jgi:ribosomal protein S18 acetylase RimI-like enzyme